MALDVPVVRQGIKQLLTIALGTEVQIATAPDQLTPPCLFIGMPAMEYHKAFQRGLDVMNIPIHAILPRTADQGAVDKADEWISGDGPTAVVNIVNGDKTLSGACQSSVVKTAIPEVWPGSTGELPSYVFDLEVYG